jgi:beta-lactamase regulating signal transducer with metallopeptidase domain
VTTHSGHNLWIFSGDTGTRTSIILTSRAKNAFIVLWEMLFLYQLIRFSRSIYRVHRLRRDALPISPDAIGIVDSMLESSRHVALLESTAIDDPVTVGVFHPAILLPSKLLPSLGERDLTAILAHEYGHIRRKDFVMHLLSQTISLPVAWHPGIRYLMSKISQTRELACDDYAAARLGKRLSYARTLVRLASLCLQVPRDGAMELGIFDGDNLEERIMMLTEKRTSLSRTGLTALWQLAFYSAQPRCSHAQQACRKLLQQPTRSNSLEPGTGCSKIEASPQ